MSLVVSNFQEEVFSFCDVEDTAQRFRLYLLQSKGLMLSAVLFLHIIPDSALTITLGSVRLLPPRVLTEVCGTKLGTGRLCRGS